MRGAIPFLCAVFAVRAALGALFQAPGAAGPVLLPEFGLDWTAFGTLVGLFWFPGLVLVYPLGLAARCNPGTGQDLGDPFTLDRFRRLGLLLFWHGFPGMKG